MLLSSVAVDPVAVEDGDWVKDIPEMGDLELRVRGQNSSAWVERRQKLINALPRNLKNRTDLPAVVSERITDTLLIDVGILDWKNMAPGFEYGREPKPYSKELAEKLIKDKRFFLFRMAALFATARVGEAAYEADEELAGNSKNSSSGSSATEGQQVG